MHIAHLTYKEYLALLTLPLGTPSVVGSPETAALVVDCADRASVDAEALGGGAEATEATPPLPVCVVIAVNHPTGNPSELVDVVAGSTPELETLVAAVVANPHAAAVLVQVLRESLRRSVASGLHLESLAYSTLQHGAEFQAWLAQARTPVSGGGSAEACVVASRSGAELSILLNRPEKRNAFSAAMRNGLCEALQVARVDHTVRSIRLTGAGPAFCAGGDLTEFGAARDATLAHLSRTSLSAGLLLHELADRVTVDVGGACVGAGIELPSFARNIRASSDSYFQLPEVSMGLIPGAGGTVSLPRRIGRHRTAWLALSGRSIGLQEALEWGLVDEALSN